MKTKSIILLVIAGLFVLAGCTKLEEVRMSSTTTRPKLTAPASGTTYKISATNINDTLIRFTWNPANYGFEAAVTYTLQMSLTSSFTTANTLGTSTTGKFALPTSAINTTLLLLGADTSVYTPVNYRIMAVINSKVNTIYSDTGSVSIKAFQIYIKYPRLYVPGDYQGWNAADSTTVIWSPTNNSMYEGYLYLSAATSGMKFLKIPTWDIDNTIGDPNSNGISGTLQIGNWGGNNINVSGGPGVFKVNADLPDKTYSWKKTVWTIIGDATAGGWNTDTQMTYSTTTKLWTVTTNLTAGGLKFRANADWGINLGDNNGDKKLEYGGSNITIPAAGNYSITLDLTQAIYKYKLVKN